MALRLAGAFTAMVTPFRGGAVDLAAVESFTAWQVAEGIGGLVPCGTTGESPTVTAAEAKEIIAAVLRVVNKRVPVIAGTGTNATAETIARTQTAEALGVDAAMVVMPYYNKPSQAGLLAHVRAVHDATSLPIVLYNVPTRGTADLAVETMVDIARHCPRVIALKEATGNIVRAQAIIAALGDRLTVLCGDDALTVGMMACGARGVISVASNVVPAAVQAVVTAFLQGDVAESRRRQQALLGVYDAMFVESNPGPVKAALAWMGKIPAEIRLPLAWPAEASIAKTLAALRAYGLQGG